MKELQSKIDKNKNELTNLFDKKHEFEFEFKGISITNPMIDSSDRYGVNPIDYYGRHFLESDFIEVIESL